MNTKAVAFCLGAVLALAIVLIISGVPPLEALQEFYDGSLGNARVLSGTFKLMTPLLIAGVAVFIALKAGLFNIGAEGQIVVGAMSATVVALAIPGLFGGVLAAIAAMAVGGLWAAIPGWIKAYRNGHEVISTIMLNSVAGFFTGWLVAGPIRGSETENTETASLSTASYLPDALHIGSLRLNWALVIGLVLVAILALYFRRTVSGFEISLLGANSRASELAGVDRKPTIVKAMSVSGAIAGLCGALMVLGFEHRFYAQFSPGYGFDALGVALLSAGRPVLLIPAAFAFGLLNKGSAAMQLVGVPKGMSQIALGLLILVFAVMNTKRQAPHD